MLASEGRSLDYEIVFGLWLNLDRQRYQRAVEIALGFYAGCSLEPLSREWADALAWLEDEVEETHYGVNARRSDARAVARMKSGRFFG